MTPFSFEWHWNIDYFIFFGLLYTALTIIGCGVGFTYIKSWLDLMKEKEKEEQSPEIEQRLKYTDY